MHEDGWPQICECAKRKTVTDPLKGLKPTPYARVSGESVDVATQHVLVNGEHRVSGRRCRANLLLIADAFNTYTTTGLAPSQLAARVAELELALAENEVLLASEDYCMCGIRADMHTIGDGHGPVTEADYAREKLRELKGLKR